MTKFAGVGRGGTRPGAGRKRRGAETETRTKEKVAAAAKMIATRPPSVPDGPIKSPDDLLDEAYATLRDVTANSPFPTPRVTAARFVIEQAKQSAGEGKPEKGGKMAERAAAAQKSWRAASTRQRRPLHDAVARGSGRGAADRCRPPASVVRAIASGRGGSAMEVFRALHIVDLTGSPTIGASCRT